MLKRSHIVIAKRTLSVIESENNSIKINKIAYLFGSIAPDLNCIYPTHTISNTFKRFSNRLSRVDNIQNNLVISFTLGVITHYICDYFCYAHNLGKVDPMHAVYERLLRSHIIKHEEIFELPEYAEVKKHWEYIKEHIRDHDYAEVTSGYSEESIAKAIEAIHFKSGDHIEDILKSLAILHKSYMEESFNIGLEGWYNQKLRMLHDEVYSHLVCCEVLNSLINSRSYLQINQYKVTEESL